MDFISNINEETLIICSNTVKKQILTIHKLLPIKCISLMEFIQKYYFSYDEEAILYLVKKYNMKYEVASNYLENIYYVLEDNYDSLKLNYLVELKQELINNKLLIFNDNFKDYLKRVKLILYDIHINNFILHMLDGLDYQIIERDYQSFKHQVIEFDSMEDEVNYVAYQIAKLIDNGVDIRNIKLTNVDAGYYNTIDRIFACYNIKANIRYQTPLANYSLVKTFIDRYQTNDNIQDILDEIDDNSAIFNELVNVINKYLKYQDKELIIYKLKHTYVYNDEYTNGIEIVNYLDYIFNDNEFVFMLGFNDGIIPKNTLDTNYITDNICQMVGLNSSKLLNIYLFDKTVKIIGDIKNLFITYKLHDFNRTYYPSVLCQDMEVISDQVNNYVSYSEEYDKLKLAMAYDNYFKYGEKSNNFDLLYQNYHIRYDGYSNKYSKIDRVMNSLTLSYSKMQSYNKCAFKYYLSDILKLDIFEENFSSIIGSMVHYVMEKCLLNNSNDIDYYVREFLGDKEFTKKEKFFLQKYKECIHELLDQVVLEKEYSLFKEAMYEKRINIDLGNKVRFVGVIDKVLYYVSDDTTYVTLIDYKTGMDEIGLSYLKYGLNIQLPIYLYLSTKLGFKKMKWAGFYLQRFNLSDRDFRLVGYSNKNEEIISLFDKDYNNSKIIKGLKMVSTGGFSKNSRVLSDDDMDKIVLEVEDRIGEVIKKIKDNDFTINPKTVMGKNIGCEYCRFRDICFKTYEDEVAITPKEFGGEE